MLASLKMAADFSKGVCRLEDRPLLTFALYPHQATVRELCYASTVSEESRRERIFIHRYKIL